VVAEQRNEDLADAMELVLLSVGQVMTGEGERWIGNMPAEAYWSPWSLQSLQTCFDDDDDKALSEAEVSMYIDQAQRLRTEGGGLCSFPLGG
jgi:hypothetical protein